MHELFIILTFIVYCNARYYGYDSNGYSPGDERGGEDYGVIIAAIDSSRDVEVKHVETHQEPIKQTVVEVPSIEIPVKIIYNSKSSEVVVEQRHEAGSPGQTESTKSEEEPHKVVHEVVRPVLQELREVIVPYRRVVQEIQPVIEEIQTVVARGEGRANGGGGPGLGGGVESGLGGGHESGLEMGGNVYNGDLSLDNRNVDKILNNDYGINVGNVNTDGENRRYDDNLRLGESKGYRELRGYNGYEDKSKGIQIYPSHVNQNPNPIHSNDYKIDPSTKWYSNSWDRARAARA